MRLLALCLCVSVAAAPEWEVSADGLDVPLQFSGKVTIDRRQVIQYLAPAVGLLIETSLNKGDRVREGDVIQSYSTDVFVYEIPDELREMEEAERKFEANLLDLKAKLRVLSDQRQDFRNQLAISEARLIRQENADPATLKLLEQRAVAAAADAADFELEYRNIEDLYKLGQLTRNERDAAGLKRSRRQQRAEAAKRAWRIAADDRDEIAIATTRLRLEQMQLSIAGLSTRIAALERNIDSARSQHAAKLEEEIDEYQATLRHAYDHTPLCWIEVETAAGTRVIDFGNAESAKAWDGEQGWEDDLSQAIVRREGDSRDHSLLLLRGEHRWRMRTGPGKVTLRLRFGDTREWEGALVHHEETLLFVKNALKAKRYVTSEHELEVSGEVLELTFGSPVLKALRAEQAGIISRDPWAPGVGAKTYSYGWPVAYITPPRKYHVSLRMRPELATLFRDKHVADIAVELPTGEQFPAKVGKVGSDPVPIAFTSVPWHKMDDTRDNVGRDVRIDLAPELAAQLRLESAVKVRATAKLAPGTPWIPVAYLETEGEAAQVTLASGEVRKIEGMRAGDVFAISAGLVAGERVRVPEERGDAATQMSTFDGVVEPGQRVEVRMPRSISARVQDLAPEGSYLKDGDWIMTLYSNTQRELEARGKNRRRLARETYAQSAKKRELQRLADEQDHKDNIIDEQLARVALRVAERDPAALAVRKDAHEQARLEYAHARELAQRLATLRGASSELKAREREQQLAAIGVQRARLNLVRTERIGDWLKQRDREFDWANARDKLDDREATAAIARQSQEVDRLQAQMELQEDLETSSYLVRFEKNRNIRSPAEGRLLYRQSYNLMTQRPEKIGKEFELWSGMVIAEILDMSELTFATELPEAWYHRIDAESPVRLRFSHLGELELEGQIQEIGRVFYVPTDLEREGVGAQSVSNLKHFKVIVAFRPPAEFAEEVIPGVKGKITFPDLRTPQTSVVDP